MATDTTLIPKIFHSAVERWRERFLPDYDLLLESWEKFFPNDERFRLCAHRECGMCATIEVGDETGKPKYTRACDMREEQAHHLLAVPIETIERHGGGSVRCMLAEIFLT